MTGAGGGFSEEDLLPLSGLQHMVFCDRQAALIHLERIWLDNALTVEGTDFHRIVDDLKGENRGNVLIRRGLRLRSDTLGLVGKADVVEFRRVASEDDGIALEGVEGRWDVSPVEYKRGKPKRHRADEVQLCAQAICLEEMFDTTVSAASIFYGRTRRRDRIALTIELRAFTQSISAAFHALMAAGRTPERMREKKCRRCSLLSACLPPGRDRPQSVQEYLDVELGRLPPGRK